MESASAMLFLPGRGALTMRLSPRYIPTWVGIRSSVSTWAFLAK